MSNNRFGSIGDILNKPAREPRLTQTTPESGGLDTPAPEVDTEHADATITRLRANRENSVHGLVSTAQPADNPEPATQTPPASSHADGGTRRIAFRLDPDLHAALTTTAAGRKASHGQLVLDAVEQTYRSGALADRVTAAKTSRVEQDSGMFPRLAARGAAQPTIPVEIRLHARAVAILDDLCTQLGADNRTQLLTAALREHLI